MVSLAINASALQAVLHNCQLPALAHSAALALVNSFTSFSGAHRIEVLFAHLLSRDALRITIYCAFDRLKALTFLSSEHTNH